MPDKQATAERLELMELACRHLSDEELREGVVAVVAGDDLAAVLHRVFHSIPKDNEKERRVLREALFRYAERRRSYRQSKEQP